jgi:transposase
MAWVERIGALYHLNHERVAIRDAPVQFTEWDIRVREAVSQMERQRDKELDDEQLLIVRRRLLTSLKEHWEGLILFVDHPEIPMDNNAAERALRGPVVGRKNFYGSGAQWRGELATMLFPRFQTLLLWKVNPKTWLERFVRACAEHGGTPLDEVSSFLPWNMSPEELDGYRRAPP